TDNAANCDTMFKEFASECENIGVHFDIRNQRVRCLAHVVNLACQDAIAVLKTIRVSDVDISGLSDFVFDSQSDETDSDTTTSESSEEETSHSDIGIEPKQS
ncbi:unnamed protein product, partial [Allacma fusca]